ncbi:mannosyltransferase [Leucobacter sp. CSA1]|uniref:Mannosyltransferase n=1 Tax=Leucobacter chromiisoli TaxID=2796471 RepID=A0A934UU75_9MICO|nr:mannosyltransferase [Leucobacter chromiisoli]MBK0417662.1 mannosyltransferase [Leucobacter chromiisoli]
MATLTLIGEPFPDWEADLQRAAIRDLTAALAETAPRACSARLIVARGSEAPVFSSPKAMVETMPLSTSVLSLVWQNGTTARPLDGEFVHALTPMVPLRNRGADDGSQTSVTVPHAIAWEAPELLGPSQARLFRNFVRRAVKFADVLLTPTYAVASVLHDRYGEQVPVQVLPLAAPEELRRPSDARERRSALGLPERYIVTTTTANEHGRLQWILDALEADPELPPLVIVDGLGPTLHENGRRPKGTPAVSPSAGRTADAAPTPDAVPTRAPASPDAGAAERSATATLTPIAPDPVAMGPIPESLRQRVLVVRPRELADIGAILSGADLMAQPQTCMGSGYPLLGALNSGIPVLHGGAAGYAEISLDAGIAAADAGAFASELGRLCHDATELERMAVLAEDRGRAFTWRNTAWQLWELHANL